MAIDAGFGSYSGMPGYRKSYLSTTKYGSRS